MKKIIKILISKYCIALVLGFFINTPVQSQKKLNAEWLRHTCGYTNGVNLLGGDVWGEGVCADDFGNSYNSGSFLGNWFTMDTVIEMNSNRFYINKYNSDGKRIWTAKAKGTTLNSIMTSTKMQCDSMGNLYVCGIFSVDDSVFMSPNWYPIGSGYIAKYDSSGNNIWCRYIPRTGSTSVSFTDMVIVKNKLYVCGNMGYGTQSFGAFSFNSSKSQNGIIAKLDLNGNILVAKQIDTSSVNEVYGIEVSKKTGEVYIVGQHINKNLSIDNLILSHTDGATNSFIVKFDNSLKALWVKKCDTYLHFNQTMGSSVNCLRKIEIDKMDNIYVAANGNGDSTVLGSLKFNHRISPNGNYAQDIFIAKLDSKGNEVWLRNGGSDEMDYMNDLITDEWGNCVISVFSGFQSISGLIFGSDTIKQYHGGLVKFDRHGNRLYSMKLQEARSLKSLALGKDSIFYGTGIGFSPGKSYLNLNITECEDTVNGYHNPPYKMVMVKFFDNTGSFNTSLDNSLFTDFEFQVYPNPVLSFLNIDLRGQNIDFREIEIFDMTGKLLLNQKVYQTDGIDVRALPNGIYILKIIEKEKSKVIRFVKH